MKLKLAVFFCILTITTVLLLLIKTEGNILSAGKLASKQLDTNEKVVQKDMFQPQDGPIVLGFYTKYWKEDIKSRQALEAYRSYLNSIATANFLLRPEGKIDGVLANNGVRIASENSMFTFATIQNEFNTELTSQVLNNPAHRHTLTKNIVQILDENGYKGVNLDFEQMMPEDRKIYTTFLKELSSKLKPKGYELIVSVPAKTGDYPDRAWVGTFDYAAIGQIADKVQLMSYDQHGFWGEPGPVAGIDWVENVLNYAVSRIPSEKMLIGLPAYGYDWNITTGKQTDHKAIAWKGLPELIQSTNSNPEWDNNSQSPFFSYQDKNGQQHIVWYENEKSIALKTKLVEKYKLAGVSMWRLGLEDERFWQSVRSAIGTNKVYVRR
ncbi:glycosyl hydrolase family 18 protein [Pseudalkalibacillus caeni]|uniref:Spore protein O n=1 Tax=Exobacillus caeni TaxID=2574798 RepID=A0A5R9F4K8_9BACL|nr:glycosyl hydrolase family 18 protein [Pseudalkalibacillus caeni]TLS37961.1 spore protein O [Pseudalkalibacillus caeni]